MDLKITDEVVAGFADKDSKKAHFRKLYEELPFIDAYAEHTNLRVKDNPKGAIGREDEWELHGNLQLAFLISEGMTPGSRLLDVGCGVGRAARKFVPYLDAGHYVGVDISPAALAHAQQLAVKEGWVAKLPVFMLNADLDLDLEPFQFIFAHSVMTHLPPQQVELMIGNAVKLMLPGAKFLFTYKQGAKPGRTGLKQFCFNYEWFAGVAQTHGLKAEKHPKVWPAHQLTVRLSKV